MISLAFVSNSYAATVWLSNPFKLKHTPTLCIIEPKDEKIGYIGAMMLATTHDSINDWLTQLNLDSSKIVWNINEVAIPLSDQSSYNYTKCDIQMRYLPQPTKKFDTFETVAQITYDVKNNTAVAEIYYLQIENKLVPSQYYGYDTIQSYSDKPVDYFRLKQAISHEIGHAIGLGHDHESNEQTLQNWSQGLVKPPSIMVEVQGINAQSYTVTQNDVAQVKLKYGSDGFGGNETFGLQHEIGNSNNQTLTSTNSSSSEPDNCLKDDTVTSDSQPLLTKDGIRTGTELLYSYTPSKLYNGCKNSWTFNFVDEKNNQTRLPNTYYDISIQQDITRSIAKEQGKLSLFTANGTDSEDIRIKEKIGVINFWVVMYKKPPDQYSDGIINSSALLFLKISPPTEQKPTKPLDISPWVKTDADLWSKNEFSSAEFIQAIQYLNDQGAIKIDKTRTDLAPKFVPVWLKNNAKFWTNNQITDEEFVQAIQFLIDSKIIKI